MISRYIVGNVISIDGLRVSILMHENTNLLTYSYNGETYRGVTINGFVGIIRGPYTIVGKVAKEYLVDQEKNPADHSYSIDRFRRIIEVQVIGSFFQGSFEFGIKCFPMIYNEVILLTDEEIGYIYQGRNDPSELLAIGTGVQTNIKYGIPWKRFFNTHIGLFGNTGSGKSNTLSKVYKTLFDKDGVTLDIEGTSEFLLLDFNGEYTGEKTLYKKKKTLKLSTHKPDGHDRIRISHNEFWNVETLSILFSATEKTQKPFITRTLDYFKIGEGYDNVSFVRKVAGAFQDVYEGNNHKELMRLLRDLYSKLGFQKEEDGRYGLGGTNGFQEIPWCTAMWNSTSETNYIYIDLKENKKIYFNDETVRQTISSNKDILREMLLSPKISESLNRQVVTQLLEIMVLCQLIHDLRCGYVQFDHISPLISRINSRGKFLEKIINVYDESDDESEESRMVTVISLRDCNQEAKKMLPLLVVKKAYENHKKSLCDENIDKTFHLIIDEAHNILSEQSKREEESWKDYRLEVFEEIIKEGRKFGFYVTLASQRPYDISPTIISQLHNYFLHRLVNELDLKMINNTINSLDSTSKQFIPTLAPGQCIVTGTAFDLPTLVQIEKLPKDEAPASDNADLECLWRRKEESA